MRLLAFALLLTPLLAASAPAQPQRQPLEQAIEDARGERTAAESETLRLEKAAAAARGEAERLRAQQAAAAQAIEAAEAGITAAHTQYRLAAAHVAAYRQRLTQEQQPLSTLLAGLAIMARRPPLLALMDARGTGELVKVSVLLDSTIPVIRARTSALTFRLSQGQQLQVSMRSALAELIRSRQELTGRREDFAKLERRALERSIAAGGRALSAGDAVLSADERVERLRSEQSSSAAARQLATLMAAETPLPPRPIAGAEEGSSHAPFAYVLPVNGTVVEGLGAVNESGVRSRGDRFATRRGAPVIAPASGKVSYAGPFRDYDGILIIDHGGDWSSLIVNLASDLKQGDEVRLGQPIGRALGSVEVQLSHNGQRFSPALIAGSSRSLSKNGKGG